MKASFFANVAQDVLDCAKPYGTKWTAADARVLLAICEDLVVESKGAGPAKTLHCLASDVSDATRKKNAAEVLACLADLRAYASDLAEKKAA